MNRHPSPLIRLRRLLVEVSLVSLLTFGLLSLIERQWPGFVAYFLAVETFLLIGVAAGLLTVVVWFIRETEATILDRRRQWLTIGLIGTTTFTVVFLRASANRLTVSLVAAALAAGLTHLLFREAERPAATGPDAESPRQRRQP